MRLEFTPVALNDLKRLRKFIATKNPQAAKRYSQSLKESINHLTHQPTMGRMLDETRNVRELIAGDYLARYRLLDDRVIVFKIRHYKEDID